MNNLWAGLPHSGGEGGLPSPFSDFRLLFDSKSQDASDPFGCHVMGTIILGRGKNIALKVGA
ncbi:MAG TPA: hypothetical protein PKG95_03360 [Anaerolineaceae bacterium]|jgi:hypothetical protein|nr:hypothetical protein [Anaerolineaceae bacterium]